ncbi:UNVERIFIED_ORG: hypothetical protein [Escherichia phage CMSTMSU]
MEVYTRINSAGVALAEGYGSVLKGAGASMLSMDDSVKLYKHIVL